MLSKVAAKPITIGKINVHLVWFDSMGAKSSCLLIETPDVKILVDPGAAEMQPSYPLSNLWKKRLRRKALEAIKEAAQKAEIVFISHYHYDHHTLPSEAKELYRGKKLWIKDPNLWINRSQWGRARLFLSQLYEIIERKPLEEVVLQPPERIEFEDPLDGLPLARGKGFGDYQTRKNELLVKGRAWFRQLSNLWSSSLWIPQSTAILFADGKNFEIGATRIRFISPVFHGNEYDRLGWVVAMVLECKGRKILYTSDLQGPIIEDYASWIIKEDPHLLILDGPATYLLGYMLNQINLQRAISNMCSIL